jgi:TorA maturation chaperone TorD
MDVPLCADLRQLLITRNPGFESGFLEGFSLLFPLLAKRRLLSFQGLLFEYQFQEPNHQGAKKGGDRSGA